MEMDPAVRAGQAVYSNTVLALYDAWVLGLSNTLAWKCPTPLLEAQFREHAGPNHLDVGVGTGYYPHHCLSHPPEIQRLGLLDLNGNSLVAAAKRNHRFCPETCMANVLSPIQFFGPRFDSASLVYLFHCLPGSLPDKAVALDHLLPLVNPGGVLFGATILGKGTRPNWAARKLMAVYNKKGIFDNFNDGLTDLTRALESRLTQVEIRMHGCVALFSGRVPQ